MLMLLFMIIMWYLSIEEVPVRDKLNTSACASGFSAGFVTRTLVICVAIGELFSESYTQINICTNIQY